MSRSRPGNSGITRRQALTAATIGAGLTAGTVVGVAAAYDAPKKSPGGGAGAGAGEAIVVRVKNLSAGTLDIFIGTERIEVRDRDLANRLAKAARKR